MCVCVCVCVDRYERDRSNGDDLIFKWKKWYIQKKKKKIAWPGLDLMILIEENWSNLAYDTCTHIGPTY